MVDERYALPEGPMLEYDEEAESGRGDTVPPGAETGSAPRELVLG